MENLPFVTNEMPEFMRAILLWVQAQPILSALLTMMFIDVVSGACAAFIRRKLSSSVSFKGAVKKGGALLMIGTAVVLEPFSGGLPLSKLCSMFFLYHELLSTVENLAEAGVPIPQAIVDTLAKLRMADAKDIMAGESTTVTTTLRTTQQIPPVSVEIKPTPAIDTTTTTTTTHP